MATPQNKTNPQIIELAVTKLANIDKEFNEIVSSFGALDSLKPVDSYLLGVIRTAQNSCLYLSSFANDIHKQISKQAAKPKPVDPNLRPEED